MGIQAVATMLQTNTALQCLLLNATGITDEGLQVLAISLYTNTTLQVLDLASNNIGPAGEQDLAAALAVNTGLLRVNLNENTMVGTCGGKTLSAALETNSTLQCLELAKTSVREALSWSCFTRLTTLVLVDNAIDDTGARAVATMLGKKGVLCKLNLSQNSITAAGAQALATALMGNSTLTTLLLFRNKVGGVGAQALALALHRNTALEILQLSWNIPAIGDIGAKAIATALAHNTTIVSLDLSGSHIGQHGASFLATALHTNTTLKALHCTGNNLMDEGGKAFAVALQANSYLSTLSLCATGLDAAGIQALATALQSNTSLRVLDLRNNNALAFADDDSMAALAATFRLNKGLQELCVYGCCLSEAWITEMAAALTVNRTLAILALDYPDLGWSAAAVAALAAALDANTALVSLGADEGYTTDAVLQPRLQRNQTLFKSQTWSPRRHLNYPLWPRVYTRKLFDSIFPFTELELFSAAASRYLSLPVCHQNFDRPWSCLGAVCCQALVHATLLCGAEYTVYLPIELWLYIFSFWQRRAFFF